MNKRIIIAVMAFVLCLGILCGCGSEGDDAKETATAVPYTGTGETLAIPDIEVPEESGTGMSEMDKFFEEQYADMTPEEIAQFEQDLKDLGMTKEQFYSLMYLPSESATEASTKGETTAETTSEAATK